MTFYHSVITFGSSEAMLCVSVEQVSFDYVVLVEKGFVIFFRKEIELSVFPNERESWSYSLSIKDFFIAMPSILIFFETELAFVKAETLCGGIFCFFDSFSAISFLFSLVSIILFFRACCSSGVELRLTKESGNNLMLQRMHSFLVPFTSLKALSLKTHPQSLIAQN